MRVDVVGHKGSGNTHLDKSKADNTRKSTDGGKGMFPATGGVHNPSNRLPAGEEPSLKIPHEIVRAVSCLSRSSDGCVQHEEMMKSNTDSPFSPQMTLL